MSEHFPWAEVGLAKKLGVHRGALRDLRHHLPEGQDWIREGKSIQWSNAGAEVAAVALGVVAAHPGSSAAPDAFVDSPVNAESPLVHFSVTPRRLLNPHKVEAMDERGELAFITVQSNANFRSGMVVKARRSEAGWTLVGRCPRWPGRW